MKIPGPETMEEHIQALLNDRQFLKFLGFGIIGMAIDNSALLLLNQTLETNVIVLKAVSAELSITTMFILNNRYTFTSSESTIKKFLKSNLVRSGGLAIGMTVLYILYNIFSLPLLLANTAGIGVGFVFNYAFETLYTWKQHREGE